MICNISNIEIPIWISCHTYKFGQEDSRTYISNEKNHTYTQLDGIASDMWKLLDDKVDETAFKNWAEEKGIVEEVPGFLEELAAQGLIVFCDRVDSDLLSQNVEYEEMNTSDDEEAKYIEEMQKWLLDNDFLYSFFFELTYRCNLKCVHCYNPKDISSVEIDYEKCKQIIDEAYNLGCFKMTFSGGEATLHSRFLDIIKYAKEKHISVEVFTNGIRLYEDAELYNQLLKLFPYRVGISLYSTNENTHEKVTAVKGSFEKTYSVINKLRNDNVNVQIKNFLLNINCFDCVSVMKMAKSINATSTADLSLIPTINGDKKSFDYLVNEEDVYKLFTNPDFPLYVGKDYYRYNLEEIKTAAPCKGGFTGLCVSPTLDVNVCVSLPKPMGNLSKDSLSAIWLGAMKKDPENKLYQWQKLTVSDYTECYKEDYCAFCRYCPGMGYLENGFLKKSDVLCMQAKAKMRAYKEALKNNK